MTRLRIELSTFDEVTSSPNWADLLAEYSQEAANPDLGDAIPSTDLYRQLETAGILQAIAAYQDDELVGFCGVMLSPMPHYRGQMAAMVESIFVAKNKRTSGAGQRLIRAAEQYAIERGIKVLLMTCPIGGKLEQVLNKKKFTPHNIFFTKRLE